jgi:leader peptidase (prepilin peptidase)/N-methyltransferase
MPVSLILPAFTLFATTIILMVIISFTDLDHRLIPNKVTYPSIAFGFVWSMLYPKLWYAPTSFTAFSFACASASIFGLLLAVVAVVGRKIFKKDALGWGDVKYVVAIAALLGPRAAFVTILAGSIIGALFGIGMIIVKKKDLKSSIPFGPCLAAGTLIWMLRGRELVDLYWRFTQIFK